MTIQKFTHPQEDPIEIHVRTYRSLLRASGKVRIEQLIDSHKNLHSVLHGKAQKSEVDIAAFIYVLLRLPFCMSNIKSVILGQSYNVFKANGYDEINKWQEVQAPGRRRKMYFDNNKTLAVYIASVTDVDDLITMLTAFQIEWNKFHQILIKAPDIEQKVKDVLTKEDENRIKKIWGSEYNNFINAIKNKKIDFTVKLLSGSYREYAKATQSWWDDISSKLKKIDIKNSPIYFISSNTHSLVNLLTKHSLSQEDNIIDYLYKSGDKSQIALFEKIKSQDYPASREYFLYYLAKKYSRVNPSYEKERKQKEKSVGIHHIRASHFLDIDVQVIEMNKLIKGSEALIINIDYPLGWAAYQVLTEIGQNVQNVRGVYIMGKAATLNGQIGDILIPNTVFDQHTRNVYIFNNSISAKNFKQNFRTGAVIDDQKTVCVKGTFLENEKHLRLWFREGYTIIEMETGPYLNAAYEFVYYNRYVENQFVNLVNTQFDIGIVHYASDTPYSKAKNLGVRNLGFDGVEPTYVITKVILQKIIDKELNIS